MRPPVPDRVEQISPADAAKSEVQQNDCQQRRQNQRPGDRCSSPLPGNWSIHSGSRREKVRGMRSIIARGRMPGIWDRASLIEPRYAGNINSLAAIRDDAKRSPPCRPAQGRLLQSLQAQTLIHMEAASDVIVKEGSPVRRSVSQPKKDTTPRRSDSSYSARTSFLPCSGETPAWRATSVNLIALPGWCAARSRITRAEWCNFGDVFNR